MPCPARKEDGTVDRAVCESISLHPLKNRVICNARGTRCDSPFRICRICSGQRWRVFGCSPDKLVVKRRLDLDDIRAISAISGCCLQHHNKEREGFKDRFPLKSAIKLVAKTKEQPKRRGRPAKIYVREEIPNDLLDELDLPDVDSDWDLEEDLGVEPIVENPKPVPKKSEPPARLFPEMPSEKPAASSAKSKAAPPWVNPWRSKPLVQLKPTPTPPPSQVASPQQSTSMAELDNLIAFLTKTPSVVGVLVKDDDE